MTDHLKNIIKEFAQQYKIDWRILFAILKKESAAQGFDDEGNIKQRFEKHIYLGFKSVKENIRKRHPGLPGLDADWIKGHSLTELEQLSTSYGIAQIMGWHYPMLYYRSIEDMERCWKDSEEIQVRDFCLFCVRYNNGKFLQALKDLNIISIAMQYNGSGFAKNNYDKDIQDYYKSAV